MTLNTTQGGDSKGDQDGRTVRLCSGAGIHVAAFTQNPQCQSAQQQQVRPKTSASCISGPAASPSSSRIMARERWRRIMLPPPPHPQRSSAVFKAAQYSCLRSMPDAVFRGRQPVSLAAYGLCCRMHHCFCALGTNNLSEPPQDHSAQRSTRKFLFGLKDLFFFAGQKGNLTAKSLADFAWREELLRTLKWEELQKEACPASPG